MKAASIADALFTGTQQRVLGLLFAHTDRSYYTQELVRLLDGGQGAVQRELARLEGAGLLTVKRIGNQKHYQANPDSPIFHELRSLVIKTFGVVDVLRNALSPLYAKIAEAWLFGSLARGEATASSDADVLIVSDDLGFYDIVSALEPAEKTLSRRINPVVYTRAELAAKKAAGNHFVQTVLSQPRIGLLQRDPDQ